MNKDLSAFFKSENIEFFGVLPIEECIIKKGHLLKENAQLLKSVICFLVPYYTGEGKNLSKYALSKDYHIYMENLTGKLCALLSELFPDSHSYGFSDHSPIDETDAAAKCALGVIGENRLLINEKHSSFVFIGEIFTDIPPKSLGYAKAEAKKSCIRCNKCKTACPTSALSSDTPCLSFITQKKGELSENEIEIIRKNKTVWGCDICQNVCPYTINAIKNETIYTPIDFFYKDKISELSIENLDAMSDDDFSLRAYSWRKRETIRRNLFLFESENEKEPKGTQ